jgi:hypothetical protein
VIACLLLHDPHLLYRRLDRAGLIEADFQGRSAAFQMCGLSDCQDIAFAFRRKGYYPQAEAANSLNDSAIRFGYVKEILRAVQFND